MTDTDQDLLDRFAIAAMGIPRDLPDQEHIAAWAWKMALEMKKARDYMFTTAQPAHMPPPPFPKIDPKELDEKIPLTDSQEERAKALREMAELGHGFEDTERS